MIIDVHCHYTLTRQPHVAAERFHFEPAAAPPGEGADVPATAFDSCVSDRAMSRLAWRAARLALRMPRDPAAADQRLREEYDRHLTPVGPIERFVLLAFDAAHREDGACPPLPKSGGAFGNDIYSSNSFIRDLCWRNPGRFLFGASVHPYRDGAIDAVDEVFAAGACLVKWMPLHHNINPLDARTLAVMRHCARIGLPLLVHVGDEFTLTTQRPQWRSIRPLLHALRELRRGDEMPTTIIAHVATPISPWGDRESHRLLVEALVGEFRDAPLFADVSALATLVKAGYLRRLVRRPDLHHKLLFGSDFPVPPALATLRGVIGRDYGRIVRNPSWPQRVAQALGAMGFNEIVFRRAAKLLPNVRFFDAQDGQPRLDRERKSGDFVGGSRAPFNKE